MKRFVSLLLAVLMAAAVLSGCAKQPQTPETPQEEAVTIRVGGLKGPTSMGLVKLLDLGQWWEATYHAPLPLGAIAVRRDVPVELARAIEAAITASVDYANANPRASAEFIREHAQELAESVTSAHIKTFVTEYSRDLGETGRQAIARLVETAAKMQGLRLPEAGLFL